MKDPGCSFEESEDDRAARLAREARVHITPSQAAKLALRFRPGRWHRLVHYLKEHVATW
jgi:hypothetical protein